MEKLQLFLSYLTGEFDNSLQVKETSVPYCRHVNTIINDRIFDLPKNFTGAFVLEESYYTQNGKVSAQPHLFLFNLNEENKIKLTSYEIPSSFPKEELRYDSPSLSFSYKDLIPSSKFTPMTYEEKDGAFIGSSISMFTPKLKFTLHEITSADGLTVKESMEVDGRRTFGFDVPILYKRK